MPPVTIPGTGRRSFIDPKVDYGAAGDAQRAFNATISAGSLNTVTGGPFKASDVGKTIGIRKAGTRDAAAIAAGRTIPRTHVTTIATYISPTQVTLTVPAGAAVTNEYVCWGSDDTVPLRNALAAASAARKPIEFWGAYLTTGQLTWPNYCTLVGKGRYESVLCPVGSGFSALRYDGGAGPPVLAPVLKAFEIDGNGLCESTYTTTTKGIYLVNLQEADFEDLWVHHTPATAIGCDFFVNSGMVNCWGDYGGRQVDELGAGGGGSGLGIGSGLFEYESLDVHGGGAISTGGAGNGFHGLFIENQWSALPLPKGYRVLGFMARGYKVGISDNGNQGALYDGCQAYLNTIAGFKVFKAFTARYGRDSQFTDCISMYNSVGFELDTGDGQVKWDGGQIAFNTDGIGMHDTGPGANAAPHPTNIRIRNADVFQNTNYGARIKDGTFARVSFEGGHYFNNGADPANRFPAIRVDRPVQRLKVTRVEAFDDRAAGSQTQSYGLEIIAGVGAGGITELVYGGCDFRGNADGKDNIAAGVVATTTSILGGNL